MMTVQFIIPRSVARLIDVATVRKRAAEKYAVESPSLEMNDKNAGPSSTRITCRALVAYAVVDELRVIAAAAEASDDRYRLLACADATRAALEAIEQSRGNRGEASPAKGIGRAMGDV
jgi:hypothetical protein